MKKRRIGFLCAIALLLSACSLPIGDLGKDDPPTEGEKAKAAFQTQLFTGDVKPDEEGKIVFRFRVRMDTFVEPLSFVNSGTLVKETQEGANGWYVSWNPSLIFPGMQESDKARAYTIAPRRGDIVDRGGRRLAANRVVVDVGTLDQNNRFVRVASLPEDDVRLQNMAKQKGVVLRKRSGTTVDGCHDGRGRAWPWRQPLS